MPGCTVTLIFLCIAGLARSLTLNSSVPLFDSTSKLFKQISADLAPYAAGINSTMVDSVYCSTRAPGFRLQIKNQEVFIAGEVHGFQSRNRNIKLALLEVASHFADLPDIDLVIGSDDFSAEDHGHSGPILAQARAQHDNTVARVSAVMCIAVQAFLKQCISFVHSMSGPTVMHSLSVRPALQEMQLPFCPK